MNQKSTCMLQNKNYFILFLKFKKITEMYFFYSEEFEEDESDISPKSI